MTRPETDDDIDAPDDVTERQIEQLLIDALGDYADEFPGARLRARSYAEEGLLTRDRGVVVKVGERVFQVTVVRSR